MISDIYTGNLRSIRIVLEKWISIQKEYIEKAEDYPWWYNERASISILAAAAWKTSNVALEEYSTKKGAKNEQGRNGRCDIYFSAGNEHFAGEAKQAWIASGSNIKKPIEEKLKKELDNAIQDTRKLQRQEGRRIAICFAVPHFLNEDKRNLNTFINNFIEAVHGLNVSAYAYYFINQNIDNSEGDDGRMYPGNAILIKEI